MDLFSKESLVAQVVCVQFLNVATGTTPLVGILSLSVLSYLG